MPPLNVQRKIANPRSRGPYLLRAPVSREFEATSTATTIISLKKHHTFRYKSFTSFHNHRLKFPRFSFNGGRELKTKVSSLFLNLDAVL